VKLPPIPKFKSSPQIPRASPLLKPGMSSRLESNESLPRLDAKVQSPPKEYRGTKEFAIVGFEGSGPAKPNPRARTDSKDSLAAYSAFSESDHGDDHTDPNHRPLDHVLEVLKFLEDHPPSIPYETHEQYKADIMRPVGACVKYLFLYHIATKVYQLQNPSTGAVLLIGKKRTDGLKFVSTAFNFSICFPGSANEIPFKLRGNSTGTEFHLYDDGYNPYKLDRLDKKNIRQELAIIRTQTFPKILTRRGLTLILPRPGVLCTPIDVKDSLVSLDSKGLVRRFEATVPNTLDQLPIVQDYHGVATTNSIKNFMLHPHLEKEGKMCLVNGKQSKHSSIVIINGDEISPLIAFACTLTAWVSLNVPGKANYGL